MANRCCTCEKKKVNKIVCQCNKCNRFKANGKFGIAWVVESPGYTSEEPQGWQIEIVDTPSRVFRKCQDLIHWVNSPPVGTGPCPKEDEGDFYCYDYCDQCDRPCADNSSPTVACVECPDCFGTIREYRNCCCKCSPADNYMIQNIPPPIQNSSGFPSKKHNNGEENKESHGKVEKTCVCGDKCSQKCGPDKSKCPCPSVSKSHTTQSTVSSRSFFSEADDTYSYPKKRNNQDLPVKDTSSVKSLDPSISESGQFSPKPIESSVKQSSRSQENKEGGKKKYNVYCLQ